MGFIVLLGLTIIVGFSVFIVVDKTRAVRRPARGEVVHAWYCPPGDMLCWMGTCYGSINASGYWVIRVKTPSGSIHEIMPTRGMFKVGDVIDVIIEYGRFTGSECGLYLA